MSIVSLPLHPCDRPRRPNFSSHAAEWNVLLFPLLSPLSPPRTFICVLTPLHAPWIPGQPRPLVERLPPFLPRLALKFSPLPVPPHDPTRSIFIEFAWGSLIHFSPPPLTSPQPKCVFLIIAQLTLWTTQLPSSVFLERFHMGTKVSPRTFLVRTENTLLRAPPEVILLSIFFPPPQICCVTCRGAPRPKPIPPTLPSKTRFVCPLFPVALLLPFFSPLGHKHALPPPH